MSSILTYAAAAIAEIGGCFAFWAWLRLGKPVLWIVPVGVTRSGRALLHGANLAVAEGEIVGLIGPNGAGKSTFLRLLAGLGHPSTGAITLLGRRLQDWRHRERSRQLGYLPQHFSPHWDLRVDELLQLGLDRARSGDVVPTMDGLAASFDLEALLTRRWSALSGGERSRALAASVLAPDPDVLLADEPTAALDIGQAMALMRLIRTRRGATVIILHDLQLAARFCDRLVLMSKGKIVTSGDTCDLLQGPELEIVYQITFRRWTESDGTVLVTPALGPCDSASTLYI